MYHIYWWNQQWWHNVTFVHSQTLRPCLKRIHSLSTQFISFTKLLLLLLCTGQSHKLIYSYCTVLKNILSDCFFPLLLYSVPLKHLIVSFKYIIISEDNWGFTESCETGLKDEDGAVRMRMWGFEDQGEIQKSLAGFWIALIFIWLSLNHTDLKRTSFGCRGSQISDSCLH